jgi:hypothetical protein
MIISLFFFYFKPKQNCPRLPKFQNIIVRYDFVVFSLPWISEIPLKNRYFLLRFHFGLPVVTLGGLKTQFLYPNSALYLTGSTQTCSIRGQIK